MTPKEIYDRRRRLKQERMLREEERNAMHDVDRDEAEILIASLAISMERIAAAMENMAAAAQRKEE